MFVDSVFDGRYEDAAHRQGMDVVSAIAERSRVDLLRVLTELRHLAGSTEPGRGFSELAAVSVPALDV